MLTASGGGGEGSRRTYISESLSVTVLLALLPLLPNLDMLVPDMSDRGESNGSPPVLPDTKLFVISVDSEPDRSLLGAGCAILPLGCDLLRLFAPPPLVRILAKKEECC